MDIDDLAESIEGYYYEGGDQNREFMEVYAPRDRIQSSRNYVNQFLSSDAITNQKFLSYLTKRTVREGDLFRYSVGNEISDDNNVVSRKWTREIIANDKFFNDDYQTSKTGYSILLGAIGRDFATYEYDDVAYLGGSDVQDNQYNNDVYGDYQYITNIKANEGLGFFIKVLPGDVKIREKFNFNDNDDNLFCPFTALYKQDKEGFLPVTNNSKEDFYEFYRRCGMDVVDTFHLSKDNMINLYDEFCKQYKLSIELKIYYFKSYKTDMPIEEKKLKDFSSKKVVYNYGTVTKKFSIARVRGHIFNVLGGSCLTKVTYLRYLNIVNCRYNSLPYKEKDIKKLSRDSATEYNEYVRTKMNNPDQLLQNHTDRLDTLYELEEHNEKESGEKYVFIYDLETVNDEKSKFWIYSYYIRCIYVPGVGIIQNLTDEERELHKKSIPPDDFHISFKSDVIKIIELKDGSNVRIIDSCITKMMNYIVTHLPDNANAILFAHNGSNFDNIIFRELMMSSFGFYSIKEVCSGQNQNILLSLDFSYTYYKPKSNKATNIVPDSSLDGKDKKSVNVSLRDSKKILNFPVKSLPNAFNVKAYKLPYDYNFYQTFIIDHDHERITQYKVNNLFKGDIPYFCSLAKVEHIRNQMSKHFTDKFIKKYIPIITGEYTSKLEDSEFKNDIIKYLHALKKDGKYYDIVNYCCLYNKYDVLVVEQAMYKFQTYVTSMSSKDHMIEMIKKEAPKDVEKLINDLPDNGYITGADKIFVYDYRSLASIVFELCVRYGVYDDIYKLKGDLKLFIQSSVVGGRVMCGGVTNKDVHHNKIEKYEEVMSYVGKDANPETNKLIMQLMMDGILDFDAVSLYPSAIYITDMPAGKPTIINFGNLSKEDMKKVSDKLLASKKKFFICCDIKTNKDIRYPILSELNDNGRNFRNGTFTKIVIGDQALRDVVKYQDAEILNVYTLVSFPSISTKFSEMIKCLFNLRLLMKKMRLQCQETIKLTMNSAYGRTILKHSHYKTSYFRYANERDRNKFYNFLSKNYHVIKPEINCYGSIYKKVNKKDSSDPQGYPHIGSAILETSKSLMYKVFDKLDYNVFYTDTDSMHILAKDIDKVKELIGSDMCQFHSDFDPSTRKSPVRAADNNFGIVAIESIFVMKKCYYDELFCIDKDNKYCIREHKRVKGIPAGYMDKDKYLKLINGDELECNLHDYCHLLTRKNNNGELIKIDRFTRKIRMN